MAFAHRAYFGTIVMQDQGNIKTRMRVQLQDGALHTIGAAGSALADYVSKLAAVTDAWIEKYTLEDEWVTDVLFTAAEPHGRASEKALITVQLTTPGKMASIEIPCPKGVAGVSKGIFVDDAGQGWDQVDPTNTAVSDFLNAYAANADAFVSDGENTITGSFVRGKRVTRNATRI